MGALVVIETVRQMGIRGADGVLGRMQAVVLMAPDLDPGLFESEVLALGRRAPPIYVTVSSRDRALRVSGIIRGQPDRLGSTTDPARIAALPGVVVIDLTDVRGGEDPLNHNAVATSPAMIAFVSGLDRIGDAMLRDAERDAGPVVATINAVTGAAELRRN
jgi:esterase/lipase superfamily enzyme